RVVRGRHTRSRRLRRAPATRPRRDRPRSRRRCHRRRDRPRGLWPEKLMTRRMPMLPTISRRGVVAAPAALPLLRTADAHARPPGILAFGLSSSPPSIQPWANTGTAAGTVKLMIHRGLLSYDKSGALRGELAESWARDGSTAWLFRL